MKNARLKYYFLAIITLAIAGFYFWFHNAMNTKIEHNNTSKYIKIKPGLASNQILNILKENNIIESTLASKLYLRFANNMKLEAGDYLFASPISPKEALEELKNGTLRTKRLTIPEGWTRFEIAKRIAAQFPAKPAMTENEVLKLMDDTQLISDFDPEAANLEGYLYPTTYSFNFGTQPKEVITKMTQQFIDIWQPEWDKKAKQLGRTKREIIVIASLIENESKIDSERALVASVIYNRINKGIPLGIDATNVYIAKLLNRWDGIIHKSDVEVDHPYNTRKIKGIPPGPISSPSKSAIEAALNPASTDNIYYVLNVEKGDGSHHFYATAKGFSEGKVAYQRWLAKQRAN